MYYSVKVKLSKWAKENGITYRTAWNWFHTGKLPVPATQMPSGTILVEVESIIIKETK